MKTATTARHLMGVSATLLFIVTIAGVASMPALAASVSCPNEATRVEQGSTFLPQCRAYEMVSGIEGPPRIEERQQVQIHGVRVASDGERASYFTFYAPAGSSAADGYYFARRGVEGWAIEAATPPQSNSAKTECIPTIYLSEELSAAILTDGRYQAELPYCGHNEPSLIEPQPSGWLSEPELIDQNIFLRESLQLASEYQLINRTPSGVAPADAWLQAASSDFSRVVFSENAKLASGGPSGEALYEWFKGEVKLVSILPNGVPVAGKIVDDSTEGIGGSNDAAPYMHAVSADGSRVFFTSGGKLYLRENADAEQSTSGECDESGKACTVQIDASQAGGAGGQGRFLVANESGMRVFFTDTAEAKLTTNTVKGSGANLYEYDVATGILTDLTPVADAQVEGVSGFGESSASEYHLYFVANGALASGAVTGDCSAPGVLAGTELGSCSMYELHSGAASPILVAPLAALTDKNDWAPAETTTTVSPDGAYIAFNSAATVKTSAFPSGYN
ncbi:MAG: hypothetical protein WBS19_14695, partial [Candidatus Korobacteraceae bacterium]